MASRLISLVSAPVAFSEITNKPTTLSGYGITDAVNSTSTQSIGGAKTFAGVATFQSGLKLEPNLTRVVSTAGISAGSWNEALPPGVLAVGLWMIYISWNWAVEGPPYILSGATLWAPVTSNDATGKGKAFSCIISPHVGGDYDISLRAKCGIGQVSSGLEFSMSFSQPGSITFRFFNIFV